MKRLASGVAALVLAAAGSASAETNVWTTNFDGGNYFPSVGPFPVGGLSVSNLDGLNIVGSQSFPGFGTDYLRASTTAPTIFSVSGLGAHSNLHVSFDLAFIDSWDGFTVPNCCSPDGLTVNIDGVAPLSLTWNGGNPSAAPFFGPGTVVGTGNFGVSGWDDAVVHYDFIIPHAASSWQMKISAGGAGWQGGDDESWGIDNFHLGANGGSGAPEPATWAMMIGGFGLAGAALRRRRAVAA